SPGRLLPPRRGRSGASARGKHLPLETRQDVRSQESHEAGILSWRARCSTRMARAATTVLVLAVAAALTLSGARASTTRASCPVTVPRPGLGGAGFNYGNGSLRV